MSKRWLPRKGEGYWCVLDTTPMQTAWCYSQYDIARWEAGNVFKTHDQALIASINIKSLLLSLHEPVTDCNQLPKLTAEVFDRPDCPEWARYAAVDRNGNAFFYDTKPGWELPSQLREEQTIWFTGKINGIKRIPGKFDAANWQNSLIERPSKAAFDKLLKNYAEEQANKILQIARESRLSEQYHNGPVEENTLPEWVEVGGYVFDPARGYGKIIIGSVNACHIQFECMEASFLPEDFAGFKQARLRPWNFEEAPFAVKCRHSITANEFQVAKLNSAGDGYTVADCCCDVTLQGMAIYYEQMDGSPCGVLEHRENGEWVK